MGRPINKNRRNYKNLYHHLYKRVGDIGNVCFYCGDIAQSLDHVPPLDQVYRLGTEHFEEIRQPLLLIPSCNECNSILSNRAIFDLQDRKQFIKDKLKTRYARYLGNTKWYADELEELGRNLRTKIKNWADRSEWIKRRLAY